MGSAAYGRTIKQLSISESAQVITSNHSKHQEDCYREAGEWLVYRGVTDFWHSR